MHTVKSTMCHTVYFSAVTKMISILQMVVHYSTVNNSIFSIQKVKLKSDSLILLHIYLHWCFYILNQFLFVMYSVSGFRLLGADITGLENVLHLENIEPNIIQVYQVNVHMACVNTFLCYASWHNISLYIFISQIQWPYENEIRDRGVGGVW